MPFDGGNPWVIDAVKCGLWLRYERRVTVAVIREAGLALDTSR